MQTTGKTVIEDMKKVIIGEKCDKTAKRGGVKSV